MSSPKGWETASEMRNAMPRPKTESDALAQAEELPPIEPAVAPPASAFLCGAAGGLPGRRRQPPAAPPSSSPAAPTRPPDKRERRSHHHARLDPHVRRLATSAEVDAMFVRLTAKKRKGTHDDHDRRA